MEPLTLLDYCANGSVADVDEESQRDDVDPNIQDADGNTPLILATQAGYTTIVEMLITRFPTLMIDQVNNLGQSALIKAAIQGRASCAKALLRAGADVSIRDYSRRFCALDWAEYVGRTECVHMLAHVMLKSPKSPRSPFIAMFSDLQNITTAATVPVLGDTIDSVVATPSPRFRSASIPRLEVTVAPDQGPRKHIYGSQKQERRSASSMA